MENNHEILKVLKPMVDAKPKDGKLWLFEPEVGGRIYSRVAFTERRDFQLIGDVKGESIVIARTDSKQSVLMWGNNFKGYVPTFHQFLECILKFEKAQCEMASIHYVERTAKFIYKVDTSKLLCGLLVWEKYDSSSQNIILVDKEEFNFVNVNSMKLILAKICMKIWEIRQDSK